VPENQDLDIYETFPSVGNAKKLGGGDMKNNIGTRGGAHPDCNKGEGKRHGLLTAEGGSTFCTGQNLQARGQGSRPIEGTKPDFSSKEGTRKTAGNAIG